MSEAAKNCQLMLDIRLVQHIQCDFAVFYCL